MNQIKEKIRSLIEYLNARTAEYDAGNPTITDAEWDAKYFELQDLENKYIIYYPDSPTQTIDYQVVNALDKVEHNHPMLSLDKTKDLDVVKSFVKGHEYIVMAKMDGLTCSLKYIDGKLVRAETRGNGFVGEDVTHNAMVIPSIPKVINTKGEVIIDGEIICTNIVFNKYFAEQYKNPRNFAAGSIRLLDSKECEKRQLTFVPWDIIKADKDFKFLSDKLNYLTSLGFTTVLYSVKTDSEDIGYSINAIRTFAEEYYPIDGLVIKYNDCDYYNSLGATDHHFRGGIAFKFYDETVETYLEDIEWTMGRTGVLTPVAVFEPVEIDGTTVSRASLHNLSVMEDLLGTPYYRQKLEVFKANMIIPQILSAEKECKGGYVFKNNTYLMAYPSTFTVPMICPVCGGLTEIHESISGTKELLCMNSACEGKLINRLDHFCGKKGLDIKGLSKATLEKLIDWGWVSNYRDLFELKEHRSEWIKKSGFGEKSVDKILDAIESSRNCELSAFIAALGIPLIGTTAAKDLSKKFIIWNSFIDAVSSDYKFWEIPNFGVEMHSSIIKFDYTEAKELINNYITINSNQVVEEENNNLNDLSFVITGKVNKFKNRDELKSVIESRGGKVVGSISSKTSYLINNDINSTSSKNTAAKKLSIPILSEDDFIEMFSIL